MIQNEKTKNYEFLEYMSDDDFFPGFLVDKGKMILEDLCVQIEQQKPANLADLYKLTHKATDEFNALDEEFYENGSEIETGARECIAGDFEFIAISYGFENADTEELIATREW